MDRSKRWLIIAFILGGLGLILFLTHDIIITNFLAYRICKAGPHPKTFIKKTVEYPESIYWEDNLYPGFDENDRLLMIRNYLDGVHLKTMALNGPDGMIYVYTATKKDWRVRRSEENYFDKLDEEARAIASRGIIFTKQNMPQVNYSIKFNVVPLTELEKKYLWSDEVAISDNRTNEIIAYNRRLMRRFYMIFPDVAGHRYYFPEAMCGLGGWLYGYDKKVFPKVEQNLRSVSFHGMDIDHYLYMKNK